MWLPLMRHVTFAPRNGNDAALTERSSDSSGLQVARLSWH